MVAFNFSARFVPLVASGMKRQTLRRTLRCTPGDMLQFYEGQRTKDCRKIHDDAPCTGVQGVLLRPTGVIVDYCPLSPPEAEHFARATGFIDLKEAMDWYFARYKTKEFHGFLTKW